MKTSCDNCEELRECTHEPHPIALDCDGDETPYWFCKPCIESLRSDI
jgi:hypothetical protein